MPNDTQFAKDQRKEKWNCQIDAMESTLRSIDVKNKNVTYQTRLAELRARVARYSDGHDYQAITVEMNKLNQVVKQKQKADREASIAPGMPIAMVSPVRNTDPTIPAYIREESTNTCCAGFFKRQKPIGRGTQNARQPTKKLVGANP